MWRIPLSDLDYDAQETAAVEAVLRDKWLTMGARVQKFEQEFAALHQAEHAVALANCTCALELVYRYVLENDPQGRRHVIVPDITFVATANAVITAGGIPLLCDAEAVDRPVLSLEAVSNILKQHDDVAAVCVVHYAGADAGAAALAAVCEQAGVALIEDCAHAPGAKSAEGRMLGTYGAAGTFSFFSNKNLSTGEGGMIITNDAELAKWARLARSHGVTAGTWQRHSNASVAGYDVLFPGHNYRPTEITAALGLVQLSKLEAGNERRRQLTQLYGKALAGCPHVEVLFSEASELPNQACHLLSLVFNTPAQRDAARAALTSASIQTSHHYQPLHSFSCYNPLPENTPKRFTNSTAFAGRQLTAPLYPALQVEQVEEICAIIREHVV